VFTRRGREERGSFAYAGKRKAVCTGLLSGVHLGKNRKNGPFAYARKKNAPCAGIFPAPTVEKTAVDAGKNVLVPTGYLPLPEAGKNLGNTVRRLDFFTVQLQHIPRSRSIDHISKSPIRLVKQSLQMEENRHPSNKGALGCLVYS